MPNIATVLKDEVARLVRKELRGETVALKKANGRYRTEIAGLKRRILVLEQKLKASERSVSRAAGTTDPAKADGEKLRFRADGLKKLRERLDLSAPVLASILGVSAQTIYNWEAGGSRPGQEPLGKIAILRKMGKREVQQRLALMQGG